MKHRGLIAFGIGFLGALVCGWIAFPQVMYARKDQPIQFSHKVHTSDAVGLSCDGCHALAANGTVSIPTVADNCSGCHSELQGKSADEKQLVKYVTDGREVQWLVYARQPENVYFSHAPHIALAKLKCEDCHGPHGTSDGLPEFQENRLTTYSRDINGTHPTRFHRPPWEGKKMGDCVRCHQKRGVQDSCLTCHK